MSIVPASLLAASMIDLLMFSHGLPILSSSFRPSSQGGVRGDGGGNWGLRRLPDMDDRYDVVVDMERGMSPSSKDEISSRSSSLEMSGESGSVAFNSRTDRWLGDDRAFF